MAKARKVNAEMIDKQVFVQQGSAAELPYEDGTFDLVTAVETLRQRLEPYYEIVDFHVEGAVVYFRAKKK